MENIQSVQSFESDDCLDEHTPYFMLLEELFLLFMIDNLLIEVSVVCELHDDAK
jgi:hypothetical protein